MFSNRLKTLRQERDLKQSDIAKYLGVSAQSYSSYENGREPNYEMLKKLCSLFNVSADWLLGLSEYRQPFDMDSLFPDTLNIADDIELQVKNIAADFIVMVADFYNNAPKDLHMLLHMQVDELSRLIKTMHKSFQKIAALAQQGETEKTVTEIRKYASESSEFRSSNYLNLCEYANEYRVVKNLEYWKDVLEKYKEDPDKVSKDIQDEIDEIRAATERAQKALNSSKEFPYFYRDEGKAEEAGEEDGEHSED